MICPRLTTSVSGGLDVWQHHRQRWILPWLYIPPSVSRLGPLMIGACVVSKHSPCPERSSLYPNTHTHTLTTAMSHLSNSSVRDHMKWVSVFSLLHLHFLHLSTFVWNRRPSFSFAWLLCVLTFCDSLSQSDVCDTQSVLRVMGLISQKLSRTCLGYVSPQNYILHKEN